MQRGDILYADLGPRVGSEINKRRPVLLKRSRARALMRQLRAP